MNRVLRVELTEEERKELDKYLINHPFGKISHILRCAVRSFIKEEKEKAELAQKETKGGDQSNKGRRIKETQTHRNRGGSR